MFMENKCDTKGNDCYQVEAIVSFDERGQLVVPKDVRKKFNLQAGEKFAFVSCTNKDELCCITLIKTKEIEGMLKGFLGPVFSGMVAK